MEIIQNKEPQSICDSILLNINTRQL